MDMNIRMKRLENRKLFNQRFDYVSSTKLHILFNIFLKSIVYGERISEKTRTLVAWESI